MRVSEETVSKNLVWIYKYNAKQYKNAVGWVTLKAEFKTAKANL